MGLAKAALKILMTEAVRKPLGRNVLTLGRQDIFFSYDTLRSVTAQIGFSIRTSSKPMLSQKPDLAQKGYLNDRFVFDCLGVDEFASLDLSDYEGADYLFDLNQEEAPSSLRNRFDFIIDLGTIEHVFHLPNALKNIFSMLAIGGRVLHIVPSSNMLDHGFYMFSPTFFWDFYHANDFEIDTLQLARIPTNHAEDPWEVSRYRPGCLEHVSSGGLDDGVYAIVCTATKKKESTGNRVPQQGRYRGNWLPGDDVASFAGCGPQAPTSRWQQLKNGIKRIPLVGRALRPLVMLGRKLLPKQDVKRNGGLTVVARY